MIFRGAGGLGDAIYMYPVLNYYLNLGQPVEILTKYPEIYESLQQLKIIISDRYCKQPEIECRYASRYAIQKTTTYQDTLFFAKIKESIPLKIKFIAKEIPQLHKLKGQKICVVRAPALPMKGREDAKILIPLEKYTQKIIDDMRQAGFAIVTAGSRNGYGKSLSGINLDLTDALNINQLLTLINLAECIITQPSFMLPFSEALDKPCFVLFSGLAMRTPRKFYHYITPKKIINKNDIVSWAIDDDGSENGIIRLTAWRKCIC